MKRLPSALPGMMIHQDGSTHQWVPGIYWDLIVTMDDATNEHYSMRFVEEGTNAFVELAGVSLDDYLCERYERVVRKDKGHDPFLKESYD